MLPQVKTAAETLEAGEMYDRLYFNEFFIGGCLFACVFGALVLPLPLLLPLPLALPPTLTSNTT